MKKYEIRERILGILYPRVCPVCGRILTLSYMKKRTEGGLNPFICPACYDELRFPEGKPRCLCCGKILEDDEEYLCQACRPGKREFESGTFLMIHNEQARRIIYGLKYENLRDNADFIGWEMAHRLRGFIRAAAPDAIVPVPLHRERELERGYNQALLIAESLVRFLREDPEPWIPEVDREVLFRSRKTVALKTLTGGDRSLAVKGAFSTGNFPPEYRRILVIDDIYTTGATVSECAAALKSAGAEKVCFITVSA